MVIRRLLGVLIALGFLAYGLMRLVVGAGLLGQSLELVDVASLREPLVDVEDFLLEKQGQWIIPVSASGYSAYIALMGLTLTSGAVGTLWGRRFGFPLIGMFLVLYVALFLNFQTVNAKILHLAVCAILFALLYWIRRPPRDATADA